MAMLGARKYGGFDPLAPLPPVPVAPTPDINAPVPTLAPSAPLSVPMQKPKVNWAGIIADALAGAMGQPGQYAAQQRRQQEEQSAYERGDTLYSRQRADKLTDENNAFTQQMALERWKAQNKVDPLTDYMLKGGIDPASPQGRSLYAQRANSLANPPRYVTVNGQVFQVGGGDTAPQTISQLPPDAVPIDGGPTQPASGGFPY